MNSQRSLAVLAIVGAVVGGAIGPSAVFAETATRPCNPMDEQNVYDIRIARTTSSLMVDVKQAERLHFVRQNGTPAFRASRGGFPFWRGHKKSSDDVERARIHGTAISKPHRRPFYARQAFGAAEDR